MNTRIRFAAVFVAFALAACGPVRAAQFRVEREDRWVGMRAPEIHAEYVTGEGPRALAEAAGRVVVVEFWSTYCDPCRRSFPRYQELKDRFGDAIAVIAISVDSPADQSSGALESFARDTGARFAIVWDKDGATRKLYHPPSLPTSFIIAADGTVAHVHVKYEGGDAEAIAAEVEAMLRAPTAATDVPSP